ncbi:phage protease [Arthrobacter burdickii]|uniref:Phage protease n=1 Tax=Arthrobacter burdickii TaxID=3035920 RepID=A0ABT8K3T9_9MICC|nr:phage protease [Arthrobacter burdickii]MDN4611476.1 phage protease [Arthrobacter burdickii]
MADKVVYQLPSEGDFCVVELDDGRRYRKQLVKFGNWVNPHDPRKKMVLDKSWAAQVVQNFKDKVLNKVPVVEGHPKTSGELLASTRGWLAGLSIEDDGVYGELDITASDTTTKIDSGLFDDVSISFDPDYLDKLKGDNVGPALLHVGIVNDPYLKGMKPFEALADKTKIIMLSESKELEVSKVKNDRDFPIDVKYTEEGEEKTITLPAGKEVEVSEDAAEAVTGQIKDATAPEKTDEEKAAEETAAKETEDKAAADKEAADKAEADAKAKADAEKSELEQTKEALADANKKIALGESEKAYDTLLREGKIVPAQKETFIALSTAATTGTISLADESTSSLSDLLTDL